MKFLSVRKVTQGTALAVFPGRLLRGPAATGLAAARHRLAAADDGALEDYADQPSGEDFDADSVGADADVRDSNRSADQGAAVSGGAAPEGPQRSPTTRLEDVFFSVKTTRTFHRTRLDVILKTWFVLAREQ
ncbi:hypothetical protein MTO96_030739, partial [Rhipicephalus appendiculatus]